MIGAVLWIGGILAVVVGAALLYASVIHNLARAVGG